MELNYNWDELSSNKKLEELSSKKRKFVTNLMLFALFYYFLLPIGAAYFQDIFKIRVFGPVNIGVLFAFSEFVMAIGIAVIYYKKSVNEFDKLSDEVIQAVKK